MAATVLRSRGENEECEVLPVPGALVKTMLARFASKPGKDEPPRILHSIGVGVESIVATDGSRIAVVGTVEDEYAVTDRRFTQLEAERASIYEDSFDAERVLPVEGAENPANCPPEGSYPRVGGILDQLNRMKYLARLNPTFLRDLAALALAANTSEVELYITKDDEEHPRIGFKFRHVNDCPAFGEALDMPVSGIICARMEPSRKPAKEEDPEDLGERVMQAVVDQVNSGAMDKDGVKVTATYTKGRRGKPDAD